MAFQTWLAEVLRQAGLTVVEEPGWRTRSADEDSDASTYNPQGCIIHETRGSATSTVSGEIGVLINGRVGLSGPIAQLFLSRAGVWHIVAAGLCHHVKTGWGGPFEGLGNSRLLGIEAQHAESESWAAKPVQYASYVRGVAAICKARGWPPPVGHKEHQPGDKPDPEFDMTKFRADVRAAMDGDNDMNTLVILKGDPRHWICNGVTRRWIKDPAEYNAIQAAYKAGNLQLASGGRLIAVLTQAELDGYGMDVATLRAPAVPVDLVAKLDAILAAALDDGDTTVVLDPAALAEFQAIRADIAGLPQEIAVAVLDEDHKRSEA